MYTNDDIQEMIDNLNDDKDLRTCFNAKLEKSVNSSDIRAIRRVLNERDVEFFDRYDSDVCEEFIQVYESVTNCPGVDEIIL